MKILRTVGAVALAATIALGLSACNSDEPAVPTENTPTAARYEHQAQELTVLVTPERDGTVTVTQRLIFDAGQGVSGRLYLSGQEIPLAKWSGDSRPVIRPEMKELTARELTTGTPIDLTTTGPTPKGTWTMAWIDAPAGGWSAGRHLVEATMKVAGLYTVVDGVPALVLPRSPLTATWYPVGQSDSILRMRVHGDQAITCRPLNTDSGERCSPSPEFTAVGDLSRVSSSPGPDQLLYVPNPKGFDVAPTEPARRTR